MRAASLGLAGHKEEGEKWGEKLLELRPDFPTKGELLIRNHIKFDEIYERIVTGLSVSGVNID